MTAMEQSVLVLLPWRRIIIIVEWVWHIMLILEVHHTLFLSLSLSLSLTLPLIISSFYSPGIIFDLSQVTDLMESSMLTYQPDYISIYSCSWGPSDSGFVVAGPWKYTQYALQQGATQVYYNTYTLH